MADGDEIHANLPRRYQSNYKDLCAPDFDAEDTAHDIARVVCKDVRQFGAPPIDCIISCAENLLSSLPEGSLLRQEVNYDTLQRQIDREVRRYPGNEIGMDLAKRAIRNAIEDYRQGAAIPNQEGILEKYLMKIHEARFSDRVPLTASHLNGLSSAEVDARLNAIRSFSETEYVHLASSIARNPNLDRRIQRRRYNQGLGLYDGVR